MMNEESEEVVGDRCSICNGRLIKKGLYRISFCEQCNEYFPVGQHQFDHLYGTTKSFTASKVGLLRENAQKFGRSVDQLLKSDLTYLAATLGNFQTKEEIDALVKFINQHKLLKELSITVGDSKELQIVLDAIETSTRITKLTLIIDPDESSAELIRLMLKKNKSIKTLFLQCSKNLDLLLCDGLAGNSTIDFLGIQACSITNPLNFGNSIKSLEINRYHLEDLDPKLLEDSLKTNTSIEMLKLRDSNVVSAIKNNKSIKTLKILCNHEHLNFKFDSLTELLKCQSSISLLSIQFMWQIQPSDMHMLCDAIHENKSITKLHYWQSFNLHEESLAILLNKFLRRNRTEELKIHRACYIESSPDLSGLIEALKSPGCAVKVLNLPSLSFRTEQTESLALALKANTSLEYVNFVNTDFSSEALKVMQRWLVKNSQLKGIKFDSSAGSRFDLAEIIRKNTTLTTLHYFASQSSKQIDKVIDALTVNDTLTDLAIYCRKVDYFGKILKDKLYQHQTINMALRKLIGPGRGICKQVYKKITTRNIAYQSLMHINTIILIHNIARDKSLFKQLPREIWLLIFEKLRYPGMTNFKSKAESIFNSYLTR